MIETEETGPPRTLAERRLQEYVLLFAGESKEIEMALGRDTALLYDTLSDGCTVLSFIFFQPLF